MFLDVFYQTVLFRIDSSQKYGSVLVDLQEIISFSFFSEKKNGLSFEIYTFFANVSYYKEIS